MINSPVRPPIRQRVSDSPTPVLRLRPIQSGDVDLLLDFVGKLSFASRYFRFGRGDIGFTREYAERICNPDPAICSQFVVLADVDGKTELIGSARYYLNPDQPSCEFAILVGDDWQGSGAADMLMRALIDSARARGVQQMSARTLLTNTRMLKFARRYGFAVVGAAYAPVKQLVLTLAETPVAA